ncbi:MAG: hypothetical protein ACRDRD_18320 [Pseudonocardiaceae bacterium]
MAATRKANEACVNPDHDLALDDIKELDAVIDRLETSALTREVVKAATEMRVGVAQDQGQSPFVRQLREQMPTQGEPLRPDVGRQVVAAAEQADKYKDRVLASAFDTRESVKRLTAQLDAQQRGE